MYSLSTNIGKKYNLKVWFTKNKTVFYANS
ncbi:hypothetical protein Z5226 [Escherichia coli O157:H7 str. EDL933]|uniref:Uncharacterized protein n=1 Tax=Escherichia coli O157:H7 TaxID=83334 RepID=Q8X471_ECO57|nr:hypothetical protein Z5226 [Escherichia coli O157:H7 str. EDL933]ACT74495.1 predicted protein [Escherichia coli O157:H7 str. TW14359]